MKLYIIGNGFDLMHGLPSSYWNFREYLKDTNSAYLADLEQLFHIYPESQAIALKNSLWKEFESNLSGSVDESLFIDAYEYDWGLESGNVGIEQTADDLLRKQFRFIEDLNAHVLSWAEQIDLSSAMKKKILRNDNLYFTFNYTLLLEKLYKIDRSRILHIHGSVDTYYDNPPVIGHGDYEHINEIKEAVRRANERREEIRTAGNRALMEYLENTHKNTSEYISINDNFFIKLHSVKEISIIGHSLGDVDMPYFRKVHNSVQNNVKWNIFYHDPKDEKPFYNKIKSIGVDSKYINLLPSSSF